MTSLRILVIGDTGDSPCIMADAQNAYASLGWHPRYDTLDIIIAHARK